MFANVRDLFFAAAKTRFGRNTIIARVRRRVRYWRNGEHLRFRRSPTVQAQLSHYLCVYDLNISSKSGIAMVRLGCVSGKY